MFAYSFARFKFPVFLVYGVYRVNSYNGNSIYLLIHYCDISFGELNLLNLRKSLWERSFFGLAKMVLFIYT